MPEKREEIVEVATRMIRSGGYNASSFREIADEVKVKSSSVHYYFRRKEDLASEVAVRYREDFLKQLGPPIIEGRSPKKQFQRYADTYIKSFTVSGKACLCGILSHEAPALPTQVIAEVENFIDANIDWLKAVLANEQAPKREAIARLAYAGMEGAMGVATLKTDSSWLKTAKKQLSGFFSE